MCGIVGIVSPAPDTAEQETIAARTAATIKTTDGIFQRELE